MKSTLPSTKSNLLKQKIDLTETRFPRAGEAGRAWKQIHRCSNTKLEPHYFVLILDTNLASAGARSVNNNSSSSARRNCFLCVLARMPSKKLLHNLCILFVFALLLF